jgi:hypothetical protein
MNKSELNAAIIQLVAEQITEFGGDPKDALVQDALYEDCFTVLKKKITTDSVFRAKARLNRVEKEALREKRKKLRDNKDEKPGGAV